MILRIWPFKMILNFLLKLAKVVDWCRIIDLYIFTITAYFLELGGIETPSAKNKSDFKCSYNFEQFNEFN